MNPEEAETLYKKALEMCADSAEAHNDYGVFLWETKRVPEAEEHLKRAADLKPGWVTPQYNTALNLLNQGKLAESESLLQEDIGTLPGLPRRPLLVCQRPLQAPSRSLRQRNTTRRLIELKPDHKKAHENYAQLLKALGRTPRVRGAAETSSLDRMLTSRSRF